MEINPKAPVIVEREISIQAPLETVWRWQSDIDKWSDWNPDIRHSKMDGPLAPGTVFQWKAGGASIVSTLQDVEPMRKLAWTGKTSGLRAAHTWRFEQQGDSVLVATRESFDGYWARLLPNVARKLLDKALRTWLESLKRQAESAG
jgi:hypothetical protein